MEPITVLGECLAGGRLLAVWGVACATEARTLPRLTAGMRKGDVRCSPTAGLGL